MDSDILKDKIEKLEKITHYAAKSESTADVIALINISARANMYLRNSNLNNCEVIIKEIDAALKKFNKYSDEFKLSA